MTGHAERGLSSRLKDWRGSMTVVALGLNGRMAGDPEIMSGTDKIDMDVWHVTLTNRSRAMNLTYRMGTGHGGRAPSEREVFQCLISDARSVRDHDGFEDWASDYGYSTDSRQAEAGYAAVQAQTSRLAFLLADEFDAWVEQTDTDS